MAPHPDRPAPPAVTVRRAADRASTETAGRRTHHAFSFGSHYDPANVSFGALQVLNDDTVAPGHGYPEHPHVGTEIVTWVLDGGLRHADTTGHGGLVVPGQVQRLSSGTGIRHTETCDAGAARSVRFVQMWLRPDDPDLPPSYATREVGDDLAAGDLVPVLGGGAAVGLGTTGATLHVARSDRPRTVALPDAPRTQVFLARGEGDLEGVGALGTGDEVRLTDAGGPGGRSLRLGAGAEVLVWTFA
ncbi:MAG: pirin family protein [Nocardioides sp.]|nr:pirin family protein [Nocardioides sp.]